MVTKHSRMALTFLPIQTMNMPSNMSQEMREVEEQVINLSLALDVE